MSPCCTLWGLIPIKRHKRVGISFFLALLGWLWWTAPRISVSKQGSTQSGQVPSDLKVEEIALLYWVFLRRKTFGLIRPRLSAGGVDITLLGILTLIHLGSPTLCTRDGQAISWPVVWGILVGRPGGSFSLALTSGDNYILNLQLFGFTPRLPRLVYLATQHQLHRWLGNSLIAELNSGT